MMRAQPATSADFTVASPGFYYTFNGGSAQNPVLSLVRGKTYTFAINTSSIHPFEILDAPTGSVASNNISAGTLIFSVPTNAVNYRYICSIHLFGSTIVTVPPPPPPTIVGLTVRTNLLLFSTGTNAWNLQPQYSTNLGQTNWSALTVTSNLVANGTNELICGKPPGKAVFIRLKATLK